MWYRKCIGRELAERSGRGEGWRRLSWQREGGRGRSRARSNGNQPDSIACHRSGASAVASAAKEVENCDSRGIARGRTGGGQQRVARRGVGGRG